MDKTKITFFMVVTNKCLLITDYTIGSFRKIKNINFKLVIYSNWIDEDLKKINFPKWKQYSFVEIIENNHQTDDNKPKKENYPYFIFGPYDRNDVIWDNELPKFKTPYVATVDSDFEILNQKFIHLMINKMDNESKLIAMSTDYAPFRSNHFETYSERYMELNERWAPWFSIYKKEAFEKCKVSQMYYEEVIDSKSYAWDSTGYFQRALTKDLGYRIEAIDWKYQPCFIHYGAFNKNTQLNKNNIGLYRWVQVLGRKELFGHFAPLFITLSRILNNLLFKRIDRTKYLEW